MAKQPTNAATEPDVATLTENLRSLDLENKALKKQVAEKDDNNAALQQTIDALNQQLQDEHNHAETQNQRLRELEETISGMNSDIQHAAENATASQNDLQKLQQEYQAAKEAEAEAKEELHNLRVQFNDFVAQANQKPAKETKENTITLSPFAFKLLKTLSKRLSERHGKTVKPEQIMEDYLIRYNLQRWSQWFHAFVLPDKEILAIGQEINPEIQSLKDLYKALNIRTDEL